MWDSSSSDGYDCDLEIVPNTNRRRNHHDIDVSKYVAKVDDSIDYNSVSSMALINMDPKLFRQIYNNHLDSYSQEEIQQILVRKRKMMIDEGTLQKGYSDDIFKIQIHYSQSMYNQMINAKVAFYRSILDGVIIVADTLLSKFMPDQYGIISTCINSFDSLIQSSLREHVENKKLEETLDQNVQSVIKVIYKFPPHLRIVMLVAAVAIISCICTVIGGRALAVGVSDWISQTIGCMETGNKPPSIAKVASGFLSSLGSNDEENPLKNAKKKATPKIVGAQSNIQKTIKNDVVKESIPVATTTTTNSRSKTKYAPPPFD